ncbi:MAG: hypothetical protein H6581_28095 [Bacteroidia bacterium]|nr:hypothetical protein [Bacteroidia bacterium]
MVNQSPSPGFFFQPRNLFLPGAILFPVWGMVAGKGSGPLDILLHDTYIVLEMPALGFIFGVICLLLFGLYLFLGKKGWIGKPALVWIHVATTLASMAMMLRWFSQVGGAPGSDYQNDPWKEIDAIITYWVILVGLILIGLGLMLPLINAWLARKKEKVV